MPNRFDHSALAHDELTLPSGQRKLLAVYMRLGSVRMVVGLTVLSIVLSVAINVGIEFTGDHPTRHLWAAVVTAALIPLIVVPMLATWSVRLVASLATACTRLETVTAVDDLTGLATRRRFFEVAERLRTQPGDQRVLAVLMADLDNFKRINDSRGHRAGDVALRCAAQHLRAVLGPESLLGRLGGDEFAAIVPVPAGEADAAIGRAVAACSPVTLPDCPALTLSVGGAVLAPGMSIDDALAQADRAMYERKVAARAVVGQELLA
ncbi:MAG: GGDEF domain-containing protein [Thermoleophilia bacterium]